MTAEAPDPITIESKAARLAIKIKRLAHTIRWRAYWLLPNALPVPYRQDKSHRIQRDRESNEQSRVPVDEELRIQVIWGAELYGPSEADALYEGLERLKWAAGSDAEGANGWVKHQRTYGRGSAWYNVGLAAERKDRSRFIMLENFASLPDNVDYIIVRLYQLTPSLTCIVIGFVLKESTSYCYEEELRRDRSSIKERHWRGWAVSTIEPDHLKQRSIDNIRTKLRGITMRWFRQNLPGYFSGLADDRMPTAELITSKSQQLMPCITEARQGYGWWSQVIEFSPLDVWTSADCPELRFSTLRKRGDQGSLHILATLRTASIPDDKLKMFGGHGRSAYASYCNEILDGLLSNYAAISYLQEVSKDIKSSRSELRMSEMKRANGMRVLQRVQSFFDRSLSTPAVARELRDLSSNLSHHLHTCPKFTSPQWPDTLKKFEIAKTLCKHTNYLATQVISDEHSTREHFDQLSNILNIRESIRAQRRVEWISIAAFLVAAGSLLIALFPTHQG